MIKTINSIQFKRGNKEVLDASTLIFAKGEPIFEIDTSKLKIGDGVNVYADLPYVAGGSGGEDPRFLITDPVANQVLFYDADQAKWVNRALTDEQTIALVNNKLSLVGYANATSGYYPTKGSEGLEWKKPLDQSDLDTAVQQARDARDTAQTAAGAAETAKTQANTYASAAGTSASEAATSATQAAASVTTIQDWVENKFWWGSLEEYNNLPAITAESFYFVRAEN